MRKTTLALGALFLTIGAASAQHSTAPSATAPETSNSVYSGAAYQFEGNWMAQSTLADGTVQETIANCADPITITALNPTTLYQRGGGEIQISEIAPNSFMWLSEDKALAATESKQGTFLLFDAASYHETAPNAIVAYYRCSVAGVSARDQVCIAE